jgi:succinate-semialdehyde dehydrogenase/glutarate-semialdehyde dehydrogenase
MTMTDYTRLALYIDGAWVEGSSGEGQEVTNPATGQVLGVLPHASADDLDRALAAAGRGFAEWRRVSPFERARVLRRAADLIRARREHIARVLTLEQGKPLVEARAEVASAADITEWFAEEGRRAYGRIIPGREPETRYLVSKAPVGVALSLTPWNFPINTPSRKIAAGLAAGCAVIAKAAEETPGAAVEYVRAFADAGLPAGVLGLVFGVPDTVSRHLMAAKAVKKVSFTGSIPVGKHLAALAAQNMQRTTMELGGHSPVIVFDDVDIERVLDVAVAGKFRNAGQVCIAPTRFYVQQDVYGRFAAGFAERAAALKLGNGLDPATQMGPLVSARRLDAMDGFVQDARARGARLLCGGGRHGNDGHFYAPSVLADVPDSARVMTEEPFGPLAPIAPFATLAEVAERANALEFGLAAYAFSGSLRRIREISEALDVGLVGANTTAIALPETPFGGVKESGYGIEGGAEGLEPYLVTKSVAERTWA